MNKTWLVAKREYLYNIKRKEFLFAAFGLPLFIVVILLVVFALIDSSEGTLDGVGKVGYVDLSQQQVLSRAVNKPDSFVPFKTEAEVQQALVDKSIGAYFVVVPDYMLSGRVQLASAKSAPDALKGAISSYLLANLAAQVQTSLPFERLQDPVTMTVHIQDTGRTLEESAIYGLFITPVLFSIVFMMASQITSSYLMTGVVEEKTSRIMEILVTSVTPMQLLLGKLIGLGALGLTQLAVWGVAALALFTFGHSIPFLSGVVLPSDLIVIGVIYFFLGYFLFASIMAGIGAISGSDEESRQYAGIISIVLAIPFFAIVTFLTDPNGTIPVLLTLIPFTAPLTVILRESFGSVPAAELIASIIILLLTSAAITAFSARVFRWGLLMYGKRLTPRELWRVFRASSKHETGATRPTQEAA
jgi:ABC-2 type transport system permease protein